MNKIILDLTGCKSLYNLHVIIEKAFSFPVDCGKNLNALWDFLQDFCLPNTTVYIKGTKTLPKGFDDYMKSLYGIFEDIEKEIENVHFIIIS